MRLSFFPAKKAKRQVGSIRVKSSQKPQERYILTLGTRRAAPSPMGTCTVTFAPPPPLLLGTALTAVAVLAVSTTVGREFADHGQSPSASASSMDAAVSVAA